MATVTYTGPSPAEIFPYTHWVDSDRGRIRSVSTRVFNRGIPEKVSSDNLPTFLKLDKSVVVVDASKAELAEAEKIMKGA